MKTTLSLRVSLLLLAPSCGGSSDLTCEYLSDPGNCWAEAAAGARACLPAATETAVLATDRASCSFADGTRIVFDDVLPDDTMDLERLGFTIEKDGSTCARFLDTFENRMELEGGDHSAVSQLHPGGRFELRCGNGKSYTSDFQLLFECAPGTQPTDGFSVTTDLVTFSILSVSTPGELFRCAP
jgi:hypothetical protein